MPFVKVKLVAGKYVLSLVSRLNLNFRELLFATDGPMLDALRTLKVDYHVIPTTTPFVYIIEIFVQF